MTLDDTTLDDTTSVLSIEDVTTKTGKMGAPSDAGVHLQWRDVTYTVTRKASKKPIDASSDADTPNVEVKTILSHISGEAKGGSLLALMGPSGSGKTSLLNALAFRVPRGPGAEITGTVLADGRVVATPGQMARMSAYVEQEDALFALSTVRETLMFAAQLRLGPEVPLEEKKRAVELVIADLGLVLAAWGAFIP